MATKVGDTAGTAPWLARLCGGDTLVAAAQNGLGHDLRLRPYVGAATVVPALAYIAAERIHPGRVVHLGGDRIVVPSAGSPRRASPRPCPRGWWCAAAVTSGRRRWRKLLGNLVANPITTLTMRRIGVMHDPGIADLARGLLIEAVEVGRAEGASLDAEDD